MSRKDIFLSYASEDRDRILPLVRALEGTGWTVFWDRKIPIGKTWPEVLEEEITACRSVVVVWSERSVRSRWVREEANEGKKRGVLFPVRIDAVDPPFGYREMQAADLVGWDGGRSSPTFEGLVKDLGTVLAGPASTKEEDKEGRRAEAFLRAEREAELRQTGDAAARRAEDTRFQPAEEMSPEEVVKRRRRLSRAILLQLACVVAFSLLYIVAGTLAKPGFFLATIAIAALFGALLLSLAVWWLSRGTGAEREGTMQGIVLPLLAVGVFVLFYGVLQGPMASDFEFGNAALVLNSLGLLAHGYYTMWRGSPERKELDAEEPAETCVALFWARCWNSGGSANEARSPCARQENIPQLRERRPKSHRPAAPRLSA